ncbi:tetratricopeptide repeat protein, partial [Scytonema sp. NUACC26]|uniref:tetratricopeptide repeat protein n=1 Tax=Scytonema sp. NUACC26 TaxID=3140176 RepID=UPI0038B345B8
MWQGLFGFISSIPEKLGLFKFKSQDIPSATVTSDASVDFLFKVLQVTRESAGDKQAVYPLLQANLDKLDENFTLLLRNWALDSLSKAQADDVRAIATTIFIFSKLIQEFPLGSKAVNQDMAIAGYETVLSVYTRDAFPVDWAMTQNNLAIAYFNRIKGERADNLERAIAFYTAALEVHTRNVFSERWAMTQNNLANAY